MERCILRRRVCLRSISICCGWFCSLFFCQQVAKISKDAGSHSNLMKPVVYPQIPSIFRFLLHSCKFLSRCDFLADHCKVNHSVCVMHVFCIPECSSMCVICVRLKVSHVYLSK